MDDLRTFSLLMKCFFKGINSSLIGTVTTSLPIKLQQSKFILNILLEKGRSRVISTHLIIGPICGQTVPTKLFPSHAELLKMHNRTSSVSL